VNEETKGQSATQAEQRPLEEWCVLGQGRHVDVHMNAPLTGEVDDDDKQKQDINGS